MMLKRFLYGIIGLLVISASVRCAKRGMPEGGPKDTIPPVFVKALPENYSTHFNKEEIRIYFNEYIKLDNPQRQIIISPPMVKKPAITPLGNASKYIRIILNDSLKENTTYSINFGKSITDNNEGNPYPFFKYVFSTGNYVDSLEVKGSLQDAFKRETEEYVSVLLYEADENYTDSLVYTTPPTYISYTKDSTNNFDLSNLKAGKYQLIALLDKNDNYTYDPKQDKIGFHNELITIPTDKSFSLRLFKEELEFKAFRPKQESLQHIIFGYEGSPENLEIATLSNTPNDFSYRIFQDKKTDSLHFWFTPEIKTDSLVFFIKKQNYQDTLVTKLRALEKDSLQFETSHKGNINFDEAFQLLANIPFEKADAGKISIEKTDSTNVPFTLVYDKKYNAYTIDFKKEENQKYRITALPGAFTDMYAHSNDTLNFRLSTKAYTDYGNLYINLTNVKSFPVILQLLNAKDEVQKEIYHTQADGNQFDFININPSTYYIRVIYDANQNGVWDTGNFLKKQQPEESFIFKKPIEIRANWDYTETLTLP